MPGFTGSFEPGNATEKSLLTSINPVDMVDPTVSAPERCPEKGPDNKQEDDNDDNDDEEYLQVQLDIITALQD